MRQLGGKHIKINQFHERSQYTLYSKKDIRRNLSVFCNSFYDICFENIISTMLGTKIYAGIHGRDMELLFHLLEVMADRLGWLLDCYQTIESISWGASATRANCSHNNN